MRTFRESLNERLKDENFKKESENIQPEMEIIRTLVEARKAQNMTQMELAKITGINQADTNRADVSDYGL